MSAAPELNLPGHHELTVHGYTVRVDGPRTEDAGTEWEQETPPAAHIEYEDAAADEGFLVMVGKSPVDGQMVIHVDAAEALPLARIYLNDILIYGTEKDSTL